MGLPNDIFPYVTYVTHCAQRGKAWSLDRYLNHWALTLVHEGTIFYTIDDQEYTLTRGDAMLVAPPVYRKAWTEGAVISAMDFSTIPIPRMDHVTMFHGVDLEDLSFTLKKMHYYYIAMPDGYQMELNSLGLHVLYQLFYNGPTKAVNSTVEKMKAYIVEYYAHPITVAELSDYVGLTPAYCGRLFADHQRCSISQYRNRVRIDVACDALRQENNTIRDIALSVGFCDEHHFSRVFKSIMGMTPREYQRQKL